MRLAILGDIHSNADALEAVLRHVAGHAPDGMLHVGDVVGYCTDFEQVIERLRQNGVRGVCGNHDLMVLGLLGTQRSSAAARDAVAWTRSRLGMWSRAYLQRLPHELAMNEIVLFHASPDSIESNISTVAHAESAFESLMKRSDSWSVAFHGHTHKQRIFELKSDAVRLVHSGEGVFTLDRNARYLVSAGSVGQSRDPDPRTGYVLYESNASVRFFRIPYDWQACKRKLHKAGLGTRLFAGDMPVRAPALQRWVARLHCWPGKQRSRNPPTGSG